MGIAEAQGFRMVPGRFLEITAQGFDGGTAVETDLVRMDLEGLSPGFGLFRLCHQGVESAKGDVRCPERFSRLRVVLLIAFTCPAVISAL
jgi:hypothetical protein